MGLDAHVHCRCWEDGKCNPPASLAARLWYDPLTGEVNQTTPTGLSMQEVLALDLEYDCWIMEGACAHEFMDLARERIANWGGLREFQHALRCVGEGLCTTLLHEIPNSNGGLTTPAAAKFCLLELDRLASVGEFGHIVQLSNGTTGEVIHSRVAPYNGWLSTNGKTNTSTRLDADGAFVVERGRAGVMQHDPDADILFRSQRFGQTRTATGEFCLTDLSSGAKVLIRHGFDDSTGDYPVLLVVSQSKDHSSRYVYWVEPLRRVFHAAVETGHPVLWT